MKDKRKKFKVDFCDYDVVVIWSDDLVETRKSILKNQLGKEDTDDSRPFDACHIQNYGGYSWILLPHNSPLSTTIHEMSHCVDAILKFRSFSEDTELRATLMEYLVKKIL